MCSQPWEQNQTKVAGPAGLCGNQSPRTPAVELGFTLKEAKSRAQAWVRVSLWQKEKSDPAGELMCLSQLPGGLRCGLEHLERAEMSEQGRDLENSLFSA